MPVSGASYFFPSERPPGQLRVPERVLSDEAEVALSTKAPNSDHVTPSASPPAARRPLGWRDSACQNGLVKEATIEELRQSATFVAKTFARRLSTEHILRIRGSLNWCSDTPTND